MLDKLLFKIGPLAALIYIGVNGTDGIGTDLTDVSNIFGNIRTQMEVGSIADQLFKDYRYTGRFPPNFQAYLRRTMESSSEDRDVSVDYWGTPYKLEASKEEFLVRSCGADKSCGSKDDIVAGKKNLSKYEVITR